jgi:phage-related protein
MPDNPLISTETGLITTTETSLSIEVENDSFIWVPSYSTGLTWRPALKSLQFGEGYDQDLPDGIQNVKLMYDVVFVKIDDDELAEIVAFIKARGGNIPFFWTPPPPHDDLLKFKCKEYRLSYDESNHTTLTLPFIQTFNV